MWWCCGNKNKNHQGCIFSKHESKEDDDDDEEQKGDVHKTSKYLKCNCCKEVGHTIDECPRDPNIKTKGDPVLDMERVQKLKDYRVLFSDTSVTTTHFLKKCIKVKKFDPDNHEEADDEEIERLAYELKEGNKINKFARGAMHFEDYNYNQINKYVLVNPNKEYTEYSNFGEDE